MINFKNLSNTSNIEILDCFNHSFADYSIPFQVNIQELEKKIITEDINKEISVGAFRENILIGFVLHGDRIIDENKIAYNAGTGVIPEERGLSLTTRMYDFIIPTFKSSSFEKITLEVISNNTPALKSYQKVGFVTKRKLNCFTGELESNKINREIEIREKTNHDLYLLAEMGEIKPTWQNTQKSILNLGKRVRQISAYSGDLLVGLCILNSSNNRILQIAVRKDYRNRQIGSTLLNYIQVNISKTSSIINVDSDSEIMTKFFESNNLVKSLSQNEMELKIAR